MSGLNWRPRPDLTPDPESNVGYDAETALIKGWAAIVAKHDDDGDPVALAGIADDGTYHQWAPTEFIVRELLAILETQHG